MIGRGVVGRAALAQVLNCEGRAPNRLLDVAAGDAALAAGAGGARGGDQFAIAPCSGHSGVCDWVVVGIVDHDGYARSPLVLLAGACGIQVAHVQADYRGIVNRDVDRRRASQVTPTVRGPGINCVTPVGERGRVLTDLIDSGARIVSGPLPGAAVNTDLNG